MRHFGVGTCPILEQQKKTTSTFRECTLAKPIIMQTTRKPKKQNQTKHTTRKPQKNKTLNRLTRMDSRMGGLIQNRMWLLAVFGGCKQNQNLLSRRRRDTYSKKLAKTKHGKLVNKSNTTWPRCDYCTQFVNMFKNNVSRVINLSVVLVISAVCGLFEKWFI